MYQYLAVPMLSFGLPLISIGGYNEWLRNADWARHYMTIDENFPPIADSNSRNNNHQIVFISRSATFRGHFLLVGVIGLNLVIE